MTVKQLKEILDMYPEDMAVYICTSKNDVATAMDNRRISLFEITNERPVVLLTAFIGE
jgi:hypothetical protein